MILIDYSPVLISCAHSAMAWESKYAKSTPESSTQEVHFFRMINTLRMVNVQYKAKYGPPVICVDRKPYWRSTEFPNYKKNRKPMDRSFDWNMFFDNGDQILDACKNVFGWKVIDLPGLEGDDIIGTLVHQFPNERHMIISPDGDFKQLQKYKTVEQYDVIRKKKVIEKDPERWLKLKIITGDKKDGIPNIVSGVNVFVTEGERQNPIKNANKASWAKAGSPLFFCDQDMLERYTENEKLLDMAKVPEEHVKRIMDEFNKPATKPGNVYSYFASRGITRFMDSLGDFR